MMSSRVIPPPQAHYIRLGSYFKIGRHGLVFRLGEDGWIRSTVTVEELEKHGELLEGAP